MHVTLGPGVRLDVRFLGVASVLGFLLLPPAMQICGKRVFRVIQGIDGDQWAWRNTPGRLGVVVDREASKLMLLLERVRLGSRTTYAAPGVHV